ncbi:MAG TPA: hypothetical protein VFW73_12750 [Lacipirellulaceae bacterium]|nr:hypothetical protein [Lacipirellulaceae bacterium]
MSWLRILVIPSIVCAIASTLHAKEQIDLTAGTEDGGLVHVSLQLDAGGHNLVRPEPDDKSASKQQSLPMSVAAKLSYDEKRLASVAPNAPAGTPLTVRYYDDAEAVIKVGETGRSPKLSDEKRLIVLEIGKHRPVAFCPNGPLTRQQLDVIDVVGDSYSINRLLPKQPVADGESWTNDASVMGPLLTFDTVAACEVQSVLDEFNANYAKVRLAGDVQGTADGAATEQEVRGVYLFDRKLRRITRLNLAIREKRSIGGATPGVNAVAKVQVKIDPIETSSHLSDPLVAKSIAAAHTPLSDLLYESSKLGFRIKYDRQWFVTAEGREAVTFRRVDGGDLVAQCTVTALPPKSEGRQTTLDQFQKDIVFSLGKNFGELVSSRQWQNAAGLYCYEVLARGVVEDVPVEWHYYLAAPESGNRVSLTTTVVKPMIDRLAGADRELIESLQLFPAMPAAETAEQPTGKDVK